MTLSLHHRGLAGGKSAISPACTLPVISTEPVTTYAARSE
jgi:hypothetical protein